MKTPEHVLQTINALRADRQVVSANLDSIELAIQNLERLYRQEPVSLAVEVPSRRKLHRRIKPHVKAKPVRVPPKVKAVNSIAESSEAAARRQIIIELIRKSEVGLTSSQIKKATPKMGEKDRGNSIQQLRLRGVIRRAGNTWAKAEEAKEATA